jgi:hypothetical protein
MMVNQLNFKYGILRDKKDLELLHLHIIKELMELLWFMILLNLHHYKILKISGYLKHIIIVIKILRYFY